MKKWVAALLFVLVLGCVCVSAMAEEAEEITGKCKIYGSDGHYKFTMMYDGKYTSHWHVKDKQRHPWVVVEASGNDRVYGLYVCFAQMPERYEIQIQKNGEWQTFQEGCTDYVHTYVDIPGGAEAVRLYVTQDTKFELDINELFVFGKGEVPAWVQRWEPTPAECDILLAACHPDDDLIFFCGAIPTYAVERGSTVAVCYYSYSNTTRRSELLNALWSMGYRQYPIIGDFPDRSQKDVADCYKTAGGKSKVLDYYVDVIRRTKPSVIVTHDVNGEYGHGQHKMVADAVKQAYDLAAEGENGWQAQKLYLHLWAENRITVDWDMPLSACGGRTGRELAIEAFTYHVTQEGTRYNVKDSGAEYDNECFGLCRTEVGADQLKNDFLENIVPVSVKARESAAVTAAAAVAETAAPTDEPTPEPAARLDDEEELPIVMPALNAKGYLDEGEFVYAGDTDGLYIFVNQTVRVIIERKYDAEEKLTWFDADIRCDTDAGEFLNTYPADPKKPSQAADIEVTAQKHMLAFAMNTDYYTYRISSTRPMGITIRDGKILYNKPYKAATTNFPNLDTLAFYPDGGMEVNESWEVTAQEYLDRGAVNVYSFGPILLKDGQYNEWVLNRKDSKQPRCALGMVEPGHYVCILCEGRLKRSEGVTLHRLMEMMKERGCTLAINLDGGQTAAMTFMGKRINEIGKYVTGNVSSTKPRKTTEVMGIGVSEQVGNVTFE